MSCLAQRSKVLVKELRSRLDDLDGQDPTRDAVDAIISIAERLRLVASPRGTTIGWLTALLHYGHTLSGPMTAIDPAEIPLLRQLVERTGLPIDVERKAARETR